MFKSLLTGQPWIIKLWAIKHYEQTILAFNEARERKPYRQKFADYYSQPYVAAAEDWLKAQGFLTKQK